VGAGHEFWVQRPSLSVLLRLRELRISRDPAAIRFREGTPRLFFRLASRLLLPGWSAAPAGKALNEYEEGGRFPAHLRAESHALELAEILAEECAGTETFRRLAAALPADKARLAVKTRVFEEIIQPVFLHHQARCRARETGVRTTTLIPDSGLARSLCVRASRPEAPLEVFPERLALRRLKRPFKELLCALCSLPQKILSSIQGRPRDRYPVGVYYGEGVDRTRRSNLFWHHPDIVPARDILVFHDQGMDYPLPVTPELTAALRREGFGVAGLRPDPLSPFGYWHPPFSGTRRRLRSRAKLGTVRAEAPLEDWLLDLAGELIDKAAYWMDVFEAFGVRVIVDGTSWAEQAPERGIAIAALGGIQVGKQRSDGSCGRSMPYVRLCPHHVYFCWNAGMGECREIMQAVDSLLVSGFPQDDLFPDTAEIDPALRQAKKKAAEPFVIALLDNIPGPKAAYSARLVDAFYAAFTRLAEEDPDILLTAKPKKPDNLRACSPETLRRIARLRGAGRFLLERNVSARLPTSMMPGVDIAVGLGLSSAVTEIAIAGWKGVHFENVLPERHPFYSWGEGRLITGDLDALLRSLRERRGSPAGTPALGDWSSLISRLDPFHDKKAGRRVGLFIRDLADSLRAGHGRERALADAINAYRDANGKDAVLWSQGDPLRPAS